MIGNKIQTQLKRGRITNRKKEIRMIKIESKILQKKEEEELRGLDKQAGDLIRKHHFKIINMQIAVNIKETKMLMIVNKYHRIKIERINIIITRLNRK